MAQGAESDATAKAPFQRRHTKIPRAAWRFAHTYVGVWPLMPTSRMSGEAASRGHRHSSIGNHSLASGGVNERIVSKPDVVLGQSAPGFDADPVVNGGPNSLLAAEISLSRLN
jgi:hypothetical protein